MPEPISIANVGDLAKPATTLIEKISEALGGAFRPYQIQRVARAEAAAEITRAAAQAHVELIKANSQVQVTEIQRRALERFVAEEGRKQENIESITMNALPHLDETADAAAMETDWVAHFFDRCRLVSDGEMQEVWSRLLAGEANEPGAYSKRTVDVLATLDKGDATMFLALCRFCAKMDAGALPLILDLGESLYSDEGVTEETVAHLADIGLIRFERYTGWDMAAFPPIRIDYFDRYVLVESTSTPVARVSTGSVLLTQTGFELARVCNPEPVSDFVEYLVESWEEGFGVKLTTGNLADLNSRTRRPGR